MDFAFLRGWLEGRVKAYTDVDMPTPIGMFNDSESSVFTTLILRLYWGPITGCQN